MKFNSNTLISSLSAAIFTISSASGVTVSISNVDDLGNQFILTDSSGSNALTSGFAAAFQFGTSSIPTSAAEIKNRTSDLLEAVGFAPGNNPAPGAVFLSFPDFTYDSAQDLYFVFGNESTLADSTELALVRASGLTETSAPGGVVTLGTYGLSTTADVLVGTNGNGNFDLTGVGGTASNAAPTLQLQAVPEPSSVLLSSLALLAFAGRRKRA